MSTWSQWDETNSRNPELYSTSFYIDLKERLYFTVVPWAWWPAIKAAAWWMGLTVPGLLSRLVKSLRLNCGTDTQSEGEEAWESECVSNTTNSSTLISGVNTHSFFCRSYWLMISPQLIWDTLAHRLKSQGHIDEALTQKHTHTQWKVNLGDKAEVWVT